MKTCSCQCVGLYFTTKQGSEDEDIQASQLPTWDRAEDFRDAHSQSAVCQWKLGMNISQRVDSSVFHASFLFVSHRPQQGLPKIAGQVTTDLMIVCTSTGLAICLLHLIARLLYCHQQEGRRGDPAKQSLVCSPP